MVVVGANLLWEKNRWLAGADLLWEKSTYGWLMRIERMKHIAYMSTSRLSESTGTQLKKVTVPDNFTCKHVTTLERKCIDLSLIELHCLIRLMHKIYISQTFHKDTNVLTFIFYVWYLGEPMMWNGWGIYYLFVVGTRSKIGHRLCNSCKSHWGSWD